MNKIAIVYWSGTGNTEIMANAIAQGAKEAGAEATLFAPDEFTAEQQKQYKIWAFGCPSMGSEQLEESEFEPFFTSIEGSLGGQKTALFGSYGWGDGQWMREWVKRADDAGANLRDLEGLICHETPDEAGEQACRALGAALANW